MSRLSSGISMLRATRGLISGLALRRYPRQSGYPPIPQAQIHRSFSETKRKFLIWTKNDRGSSPVLSLVSRLKLQVSSQPSLQLQELPVEQRLVFLQVFQLAFQQQHLVAELKWVFQQ